MSPASFLRLVAAGMVSLALASSCATANEPATTPRIVATGDLHGDYEAYLAIIEAAGIGDKKGRWKGGDTIFVQTGDVPDRGPDTRKIIDHLRKLQKNARKKGGEVITLIGNHEAMNIIGDLRYVHPGEYEAFTDRNSEHRRAATFDANKDALETFYLEQDPSLSSEAIRNVWYAETPLGKLEHRQAWQPTGEIGEWVVNNDAVVKIGDTLFLHGGLSAEYSVFTLDDINQRVRTALIENDISATAIINDPLGPLWYRGLVRRNAPPAENAPPELEPGTAPVPARPTIAEEIDIVLNAYAARRIVVGHTPSLSGIHASQEGKVIQIDTGAAAHYGGTQGYLEIINGEAIAHDLATGSTRQLPLERE